MGKRGPAPKGEYAGQTSVLSTRLTPELRSRLEEEVAKKPNNTISREVEKRLRASFVEDDEIASAFGSRENYALMRMIAMILEMWHNPADMTADWRNDPTAYDQVCQKINNVMSAMKPKGVSKKLSELEQAIAGLKSVEDPARLLLAIQNAPAAIPLDGKRRTQVLSLLKGDLGDMANRPEIFFGTADQMRAHAERLKHEEEAAQGGRDPITDD